MFIDNSIHSWFKLSKKINKFEKDSMEDGLSPFPFLSLNCPCRALDVDSI